MTFPVVFFPDILTFKRDVIFKLLYFARSCSISRVTGTLLVTFLI